MVQQLVIADSRFVDNQVGIEARWTRGHVHHNLFANNRSRGITLYKFSGEINHNTIVETNWGWGIKGGSWRDLRIHHNLIGNTQNDLANTIFIASTTDGSVLQDNWAFGRSRGTGGAFRHQHMGADAAIDASNRQFPLDRTVQFSDDERYLPQNPEFIGFGYSSAPQGTDPPTPVADVIAPALAFAPVSDQIAAYGVEHRVPLVIGGTSDDIAVELKLLRDANPSRRIPRAVLNSASVTETSLGEWEFRLLPAQMLMGSKMNVTLRAGSKQANSFIERSFVVEVGPPGHFEPIEQPLIAVQGEPLTFTVHARLPSAKFLLGRLPRGTKIRKIEAKQMSERGYALTYEWTALEAGHQSVEISARNPTSSILNRPEYWRISTTVAVEVKTSCQNGKVDPWEDCETGACCDEETCSYKKVDITCRERLHSCDVPETCTGKSAECPAHVEPEKECVTGDCCDEETCTFKKADTVCRGALQSCDVPEVCSGTSADCPAPATTCQIDVDDGPVVLAAYPLAGQTVGPDSQVTVVHAGGSRRPQSVAVLDASGNDITDSITRRPSGIGFPVTTAVDGEQRYTVHLDDRVHELSFQVDAVPPVTTISHDSGVYRDGSLTIQLSSSEPVTLYYSLDDTVPAVGMASTKSASLSAGDRIELTFTTDTVLRFFAVDAAKNREIERKRVYLFQNSVMNAPTPNVTVNSSASSVDISWRNPDDASQIRVYRAVNAVDVAQLNTSRANAHPPSSSLRIAEIAASEGHYQDPITYPGATVAYGITVVSGHKESVLSPLKTIKVPVAAHDGVFGSDLAIARRQAAETAIAWLEANQGQSGCWGDTLPVVATAQVLVGLHATDVKHRMIGRGLHCLASQPKRDNDSLARAIVALKQYGRDTESMRVRLLANAQLDGSKVVGWGVDPHLEIDPVSTAVGLRAVQAPLANAWTMAAKWPRTAAKPGWTPSSPASVTVAAEIARGFPNDFVGRIVSVGAALAMQDRDANSPHFGSFGGRIDETASALLGLPLTAHRDAAIRWIIAQQANNGSWQNSPFVTGLVLEALGETGTSVSTEETIVGVAGGSAGEGVGGTESYRLFAIPKSWKSSIPPEFSGTWKVLDGALGGMEILAPSAPDKATLRVAKPGRYRLQLVGSAGDQAVSKQYVLNVTDGPLLVRPKQTHYELPLIDGVAELSLQYFLLDKSGGVPKTWSTQAHPGTAPQFSPSPQGPWSPSLASAPRTSHVKFTQTGRYVLTLDTQKGSEAKRDKIQEVHSIVVDVVPALSGLALHWEFSQFTGTRATDSTSAKRHGVGRGGVRYSGSNRYALFPTGNQGAEIRYDWPQDQPRQRTYTLAFWAWADTTVPKQVEYRTIVRLDPLLRWGYVTNRNLIFFEALSRVGYPNSNSAKLIPGQWNHHVVSVDGDSLSIVVNGVLVNKRNVAREEISQPFRTLILGTHKGDAFVGGIEDVRLFNRALTLQEIKDLHDSAPHARHRTSK